MKLTVNSFFCGAGGMDIGFIDAGFEIVGAWDFDKYAVDSYRANVGEHVKQMDITQMTWKDVPKASVWIFGFPCQDLSQAGRKAGIFEGKRSGLFFEVMRLLDETAENALESLPTIIVAENVKGLKPFLPVLEEEYYQQGYQMQYRIFNSKYWGVPQNRERYFVVGIRQGSNVSFSFPEEQHDFIPKLATILEKNVDGKYYLSDDKAMKIIEKAIEKLSKKVGETVALTECRTEEAKQIRKEYKEKYGKDFCPRRGKEFQPRTDDIANCATANTSNEQLLLEPKGCSLRTRTYMGHPQGLEIRKDTVSNTVTSVTKDALILEPASLEELQSVYTDKNGCAYACNARYYKGASYADVGKCRNTQVIEITDNYGENNGFVPNDVACTCNASYHKGLGSNQQRVTVVEVKIPDIEVVGLLDMNAHEHSRRVHDPEGISPTVTAVCGGTHHIKILEPQCIVDNKQVDKCRMYTEISPTLLSTDYKEPKLVVCGYRVRKLTPCEYGRLQGFPMDTWKYVVSNTQLYKQFGNAVTTTVAKAIAIAIKEALYENNK